MSARVARFAAMCVPGQLEDGSDSWWFVHDRRTKESDEIGPGDASRQIAFREARRQNGNPS